VQNLLRADDLVKVILPIVSKHFTHTQVRSERASVAGRGINNRCESASSSVECRERRKSSELWERRFELPSRLRRDRRDRRNSRLRQLESSMLPPSITSLLLLLIVSSVNRISLLITTRVVLGQRSKFRPGVALHSNIFKGLY